MGAENFNRQFILLDFADLDNPDFLAFTRSPEFSTYLVMRRHVWRSREPHYMGLHALYADGALACSLEREQIAELLGLSLVSISSDIQALARRAVIESRRTGRQNIFVLGRWVEDQGSYHEHFHLDRLYVRSKENLISTFRDARNKESFTSDDKISRSSDLKFSLANNREGNKEENRTDHSNIRSAPPLKKKGGTGKRGSVSTPVSVPESAVPQDAPQPRGARARAAVEAATDRLDLAGFVEDLRRELNDRAPAGATLTRAVNLYRRSGLSAEDFQAVMYDARRLTQRYTGSIRAERVATGASAVPAKPKMAYFFGVLQNALGLDEATGASAADTGTPAAARTSAPDPVGRATSAPGGDLDANKIVIDAARSRGIEWRLARQLAEEEPQLLAEWLDHGGVWALARDPGAELARLIRARERPPRTRNAGD